MSNSKFNSNSISNSKEQLLELTRSGLWDIEPNLELFRRGVEQGSEVDGHNIDWDCILKLAREQTLLGIVYSAICKLPKELQPKRELLMRLHTMLTLNRQYYALHCEVLGKLLKLLQEGGIEQPVLLKGLGVADNYIDPTIRQCGDIDLYVGEELYKKACDLVINSGDAIFDEYSDASDHHFHLKYCNVDVEIHKNATSATSIAYHSKEFMQWNREQLEGNNLRVVDIGGQQVYLAPYEFEVVYLFYHAWRHFLSGGIGLRQFCDWSRYIDAFSHKIDKDELAKLLKYYGIERPFALFSAIAVEELGLSADKFPNYDLARARGYKKVLDRIWVGGNFGFYREGRSVKKTTLLGRKMQTLSCVLSDMVFIFKIDPLYALNFYLPSITHRAFVNLPVLLTPTKKI